MKSSTPVLGWEYIALPWYAKFIPFLKWDIAKKQFDIFLKKRISEEVNLTWDCQGYDPARIRSVFDIIARNCGWPNSLFVPQDKCEVVFWDHGLDMDGTFVLAEIEDSLGKTIDFSRFADRQLGEFVKFCLEGDGTEKSLGSDLNAMNLSGKPRDTKFLP